LKYFFRVYLIVDINFLNALNNKERINN